MIGTLLKKKPALGIARSGKTTQQAVTVYLSGICPAGDKFDLGVLEDQIEDALYQTRAGRLDGNMIGLSETVLYLYGPDAERLCSVIAPIIRGCRLFCSARFELRLGGPGASTREIKLAPVAASR